MGVTAPRHFWEPLRLSVISPCQEVVVRSLDTPRSFTSPAKGKKMAAISPTLHMRIWFGL